MATTRHAGIVVRNTTRRRVDLLRASAFTIGQCAVAAAAAWAIAHDVIGHPRAFFAPIAALIALGAASADHTRRVFELTLGVAVGIGVGDLLIYGIGTGAWQVGLVVLLAMGSAVLLGGGPLFVSQAASSAVLVATLAPSGLSGSRFVDALVGGGIGLAVVIVLPRNPVRRAMEAGAPVFAELAGTLEMVARALETGDVAGARESLARARAAEATVGSWREELALGLETSRLSPPYWRARTQVERYAAAAGHLELAIRNARVLARSAIRATELEPDLPPELPDGVRSLANATRELEATLAGRTDGSASVQSAIEAAVLATRALDERPNLSVSHVVGQVRSLATDLLRAQGIEDPVAVARIRFAAEHG